MDLNKLQYNGMKDLTTFFLNKILEEEKLINPFLLKKNPLMTLLVQVYVDDIIFRSTNKSLCEDFVYKMQGEFEVSVIGELNNFLGLQLK